MKNPKDKKYYEDIYDRVTVKHCRRKLGVFRDTYKQLSEDKEKHNFSQETVDDSFLRMVNFMMYYEKAYRYRDREKTLQEMMNKDKLKDGRIENAEAPLVNCLKCKSELIPKHVDAEINNKILYMYDCLKGCYSKESFLWRWNRACD